MSIAAILTTVGLKVLFFTRAQKLDYSRLTVLISISVTSCLMLRVVSEKHKHVIFMTTVASDGRHSTLDFDTDIICSIYNF